MELEEDFLRGVLSVFQVAEEAQRGGQHEALVLAQEALEGLEVARFGGCYGAGAIFRTVHPGRGEQQCQRFHPS